MEIPTQLSKSTKLSIIQSAVSESKISMMAERYNLYLSEKQKIEKKHSILNKLSSCFLSVQSCWLKITPIWVRGVLTQFELFQYNLRQFYRKPKADSQNNQSSTPHKLKISKNSIQNNLENGRRVIGIVYSKNNMNDLVNFLNDQFMQKIAEDYQLCPLCLQGDIYKQQYYQKLVGRGQMLLVFWKGLFDELIILNTIYLYLREDYNVQRTNQLIFHQVEHAITQRFEYQRRIKQKAELKDQILSQDSDFATTHKLSINGNDRQQIKS